MEPGQLLTLVGTSTSQQGDSRSTIAPEPSILQHLAQCNKKVGLASRDRNILIVCFPLHVSWLGAEGTPHSRVDFICSFGAGGATCVNAI
eukprot:6480101-Amphidinium_carterae.3